jgi:dihydrofolate reductase
MTVSLVVAMAENGMIGRKGDLPWRLSADLRRFKRLTLGHPLVMGRRTWQSIGRPLPGRTSIIVSRNENFATGFPNALVAHDFDSALDLAQRADGGEEAFIIGGAAVYETALTSADRIHLTRVHAAVPGDVSFPPLDWSEWQRVESERHPADDRNEFDFSFELYERKS